MADHENPEEHVPVQPASEPGVGGSSSVQDSGGLNQARGEPPESGEEYQKRLAYYLQRLEDDNEGIRWTAAESLGRLEDPAAVEPLIDTLWDDDPRVRLKAAWALGQIGDPRALRPLQQLYRMENENVREIIEKAINELKRRMSMG
jgi:HEAT repeats